MPTWHINRRGDPAGRVLHRPSFGRGSCAGTLDHSKSILGWLYHTQGQTAAPVEGAAYYIPSNRHLSALCRQCVLTPIIPAVCRTCGREKAREYHIPALCPIQSVYTSSVYSVFTLCTILSEYLHHNTSSHIGVILAVEGSNTLAY